LAPSRKHATQIRKADMSRRRFYAPPEAFALSDRAVTLSMEEARHARDVLRLGPGDEVYVFDGEGKEYRGAVDRFDRKSAIFNLLEEVEPSRTESPVSITLAMALLKGDKFDLVVQKVTELGVHHLVPLITARTDVRIRTADDAKRKVTRWQRIALEATKQCGRARLIKIEEPITFENLIRRESGSENQLRLMFSERDGISFNDLVAGLETQPATLIALVGPEGGWSDEERDLARARNWKMLTLGGRTLRAETAGITIPALLQHRFGDFV
jgi:16S rRNA (uracil1498-N3)-methyltransferase